MKTTVTLIGATVVLATSSVAAHQTCFGTSAMTCNPWQQSLRDDAYFQTGGRAKHKDPKTGLIQVFCPVFNQPVLLVPPPPNIDGFLLSIPWKVFRVTYKDPDGPGENYRITAALRFVDTTGQVQTVAELDSNQQTPGSTTDATMETQISEHKFDFSNRYYYVQIGIDRKDIQGAPDVAGYSMCAPSQNPLR
jgi:hypothetical protein